MIELPQILIVNDTTTLGLWLKRGGGYQAVSPEGRAVQQQRAIGALWASQMIGRGVQEFRDQLANNGTPSAPVGVVLDTVLTGQYLVSHDGSPISLITSLLR